MISTNQPIQKCGNKTTGTGLSFIRITKTIGHIIYDLYKRQAFPALIDQTIKISQQFIEIHNSYLPGRQKNIFIETSQFLHTIHALATKGSQTYSELRIATQKNL